MLLKPNFLANLEEIEQRFGKFVPISQGRLNVHDSWLRSLQIPVDTKEAASVILFIPRDLWGHPPVAIIGGALL